MVMEDIGLFNQVWQWLRSRKDACWRARTAVVCCRDKTSMFIEQHWPMVCKGCSKLGSLLRLSLIFWMDSALRGFQSFIKFGSVMLLLIMWSCFLSLTSMYCLVYVLVSMVTAGVAVQYLGYTPGLFIVGLFAILILWMYANFWITGLLLIVGGMILLLLFGFSAVLSNSGYSGTIML